MPEKSIDFLKKSMPNKISNQSISKKFPVFIKIQPCESLKECDINLFKKKKSTTHDQLFLTVRVLFKNRLKFTFALWMLQVILSYILAYLF